MLGRSLLSASVCERYTARVAFDADVLNLIHYIVRNCLDEKSDQGTAEEIILVIVSRLVSRSAG